MRVQRLGVVSFSIVVFLGCETSDGSDTAADLLEDGNVVDVQENSTSPAYDSSTWESLGGPAGGVGYDIRINPDNPAIMYVTDVEQGLFKSIDGGLTWFETNGDIGRTFDGAIAGFAVTICPHDSDTIWYGLQNTGNIYRSTDGGTTWEQRDNGVADSGISIRGLTIDPNDPNTIYAGVEVSSFAWTPDGSELFGTFDHAKGAVYRSTDAGQTWTRIWFGDSLVRYVWIDPTHTQRIVVSTGIFDRESANSDWEADVYGGVGVVRSEDGGDSWSVSNEENGLGGRYIPSIFQSPVDSTLYLAAITSPAETSGVYVSYDGGSSWQASMVDSEYDIQTVEIAEADPNRWYAGGNPAEGGMAGFFWRSENAGESWERSEVDLPGWDSGVSIDIVVHPEDANTVFINNYGGGNVVSTDGGRTWANASQGYTGTLVHSMASDPSGQHVFSGGDLGTFTYRDSEWVSAQLPGEFSVVAKAMVVLNDAASSNVHLFASVSGPDFYRSDDSGQSWQVNQIMPGPSWEQWGSLGMTAAAIAVEPNDMQNMYVGFRHIDCLVTNIEEPCSLEGPGLFHSTDGGQSWQAVADVPSSALGINAIAISPTAPQTVFVATGDGLYRQDNDGMTRLSGLDPVGVDTTHVLSVAFDAFDASTVYASVLDVGFVRSIDGGSSWEQTQTGLEPNLTVTQIVCDSSREGVVYLGAYRAGVYVSTDGADSWTNITGNLVKKDIRHLSISQDGSVVYAGVNGAGVYRLGSP